MYTVKNIEEKSKKIKLIPIENIKWKEFKNNKEIVFYINFEKIQVEDYKKIVKKFLKIRNRCNKNNIKLGISLSDENIIAYTSSFDENNQKQKDFICAIIAIMIEEKKERYIYIYDMVCDYLDQQFIENNLCNFKNNKCGEKINTTSNRGCCRHYKNKLIGPLGGKKNWVNCEYLKNCSCSIKSIGCKLFTCDYVRKKGVKFKIKDIFLLDTFFNIIQKYIIKTSTFTPEEVTIKKLLMWGI